MEKIDAATTAAVAVHLQSHVIAPHGALGGFFADQVAERDIVNLTNKHLSTVRTAGGTVVFTRVAFRPDLSDLVVNCGMLAGVAEQRCLLEGQSDTDIDPNVTVADGDVIVTHQRFGGFSNSVLDLTLRSRGITTLLISGVATNLSVESTARQASDLGYRTILVTDACSAGDPQLHESTVANMSLLGEVATTDEVRAALG